jgi:hypothetical protein
VTRPERRATAVFGVAVAAGVTLSAVLAARRAILYTRWSLLVVLAAWALAWAVAVVAGLRLPRRRAVALIFVAGVALRLAALGGPPSTSDDLFRYSWDGRVQAAGVDAYAHPPDSPALAGLKEPWLWPDAKGCAQLNRPPGCTRINRPAVRTIYPPVAEAWFAGVYRVAGIGSHHKAWQVAGLATEVGVLLLLPVALRRCWRSSTTATSTASRSSSPSPPSPWSSLAAGGGTSLPAPSSGRPPWSRCTRPSWWSPWWAAPGRDACPSSCGPG